MNKGFFFLILILLFSWCNKSLAQRYVRNTSVTGRCYAGTTLKKVSVPPPDVFFKKGAAERASITVYYNGFPSTAQNAFEYAVSILEAMLPAGSKLTIKAYWQSMSQNVLGNSVITGLYAGWAIDALDPMSYYPIALAEKIAGKSLNEDEPGDIEIRINRSISWYFGTDMKPGTKYDLITVVLHELCHGIGFFGSMDIEDGNGYYGIGSAPLIYDTFIENNDGKKLVDTSFFENYSPALNAEMVSNNLFFRGPVHDRLRNNKRSKLYAPSVFDSGSSICHLDEDDSISLDYPLMTPFINPGEAIHNPGDLTNAILADVGWINTKIIHSPKTDTEESVTTLPISIEVKSDTDYNKAFVGLVYSFDDFATSDTTFLNSPSSDNKYSLDLAIPSYNSQLKYYFFVEDFFGRLYRFPSMIDKMKFMTYIGTDTVHPVLTHQKVPYCFRETDTVKFVTTAYDNIGVDSVYIEYRINDGPIKYKNLDAGDGIRYTTYLEPANMDIRGGDSILYRIVAIDSSMSANVSKLPKTGFYSIPVERIEPVVESYTTDFNDASSDFFNSGFEIARPSGFSEFGLHTKHPYESPEVDDGKIEYTAMLRHPLKINGSGLLISFDEIALVEPGETGSTYPSSDFYDYVIIEGSKNNGKTWIEFAPGYDSRFFKLWNDLYTSNIVGNNSSFVPTGSLLREHVVYKKPDSGISAGDTVLLRFRLYSDPFANGWGWVIQDLKINALINSVENNPEEIKFNAYPNPGNGIVRLSGLEDRSFTYDVYNTFGSCLANNIRANGFIDLTNYESGLYLIVIKTDNQVITRRYTLIK